MTRHALGLACAAALVASAFAGVSAAALAQNASPQLLTVSCAGCHGPGGRSPSTVPSINGRSAQSVAETLRAFQAGTRPATVMTRIAKGYTDAEIDAVAREIAANWK